MYRRAQESEGNLQNMVEKRGEDRVMGGKGSGLRA
jgi:hypothetical protein